MASSFINDLEIIEAILGDVTEFAAGSPVNASPTIGGTKYTISLVILASGPVAPYVTISGSFFSTFFEALTIGSEVAGGGSAQVAVKIKNTWIGLTIGKASA
jgi:hypothetical protein